MYYKTQNIEIIESFQTAHIDWISLEDGKWKSGSQPCGTSWTSNPLISYSTKVPLKPLCQNTEPHDINTILDITTNPWTRQIYRNIRLILSQINYGVLDTILFGGRSGWHHNPISLFYVVSPIPTLGASRTALSSIETYSCFITMLNKLVHRPGNIKEQMSK